ncbi:hypothetical protein COLO4_15046 [Corchorus olitorius]|uniref:Uncharacterized protein n=1 Tax=Corchorus olitorius TaxID=93759 RepID=A0A1R3JPS0_9ROSI|nr:hypothetical protein COLO4_15046 [Corchorus olitorius]
MVKPTGQASSSSNADDGKHLSELAYQTWKIVKDKEKNDKRWRGRKSADNKYFYDQAGRQYRTRAEVEYAWKQCGIISLD